MLEVRPGMRVLVVAPHADDETIGMGGTIAKLASAGADVVIGVVTGPGPGAHPSIPAEAFQVVREEALRAHRALGVTETIFGDMPAVGVGRARTREAQRSAR